MPVVSSLANLPKDGEFYSNNCVDGHCIGCGECCTDLLPTTRREIVRLRDYAKKHQLKEHRLPAGAAMESVDLTCPFRNEETNWIFWPWSAARRLASAAGWSMTVLSTDAPSSTRRLIFCEVM